MYSPIVASKLSKLLPPAGVRSEPITKAGRARIEAHRQSLPPERLAVRTGGGGIFGRFWFMPYIDNHTQETDAMRAAYKTMLKSPYVKSGLMTKVLAVASLDWQIQPANHDSPRDKELCAFLRYCIEDVVPDGMPGIVQSITLPRLIDGYAISEKIVGIEERHPKWHGKAALKNVKSRNTDLYQLEIDEFNNVIGLRGIGPNADKFWPITEFIYTRHTPIYDSPGGMSDLRAAYAPWWMEDTVRKLRAIHAEKNTGGLLVGTYTDDTAQGSLEGILERARSNTWAAVPDGVKLEALNLAQAGESDYKSFIDDCKKDILVAITGAYLQVLEGQVSDGRGSASVSAKSVAELYQWILASQVQDVFNKQIFPSLTDLNYPGCGYPKLTLGSVSEQELAAVLANHAAAQQLGLKLSKKQTYSRTSFEPPSGPDDELQPAAPAPMPPGGGPAAALPFSESVEQFAEWKPYTNPRDGRTGAISGGGRVVYGAAAQQYLGGKDQGTRGGEKKPAKKEKPQEKQVAKTKSAAKPAAKKATPEKKSPVRIEAKNSQYRPGSGMHPNDFVRSPDGGISGGMYAPSVERHAESVARNINPELKRAIQDYTSTQSPKNGYASYKTVTSAMRKCPPKFNCVAGKAKKAMESIEAAIAQAGPLPEPTTLMRGMKTKDSATLNRMLIAFEKQAAGGKDFQFPSISSTTTHSDVATGFSGVSRLDAAKKQAKDRPKSLVFRIVAKTGLPVDGNGLGVVHGEAEIIQSAKTRYRVVAVKRDHPMVGGVVYLEEI